MSAKCPTCKSHLSGRAVAPVEEWQAEHDARWHRDLQVGDGLTRLFVTDTIGYVVVNVSLPGNVVTLIELFDPRRTDSGEVEHRDGNPYPVISYTYTDEDRAHVVETWRRGYAGLEVVARRRRDGRWYLAGESRPLAVDGARFVRDYRD